MTPNGDALKAHGMTVAVEAEPAWSTTARRWIRAQPIGVRLDSEDVTNRVGLPRGGVGTNRNNAVGAVMSAAARAGEIRRVGYRNATRPALHAAVIAIWERTEPTEDVDW